jgi:hypothetical protein
LKSFAYAEAERHQPRAERHQTAAHQSAEAAALAGSLDSTFRARNGVDQRLDLVGGTLLAKETQNDADGFFSYSFIDAGLCSQLLNQFVHIAPPSAGCLSDPCL